MDDSLQVQCPYCFQFVEIYVDPAAIRNDYLKQFNLHAAELTELCFNHVTSLIA